MEEREKSAEILIRNLTADLHELCADGPILNDHGTRFLTEKVFRVGEFAVLFYPNEGKHPGRPHCTVRLPNGFTPKLDIVSGQVIEGDAGTWGRTLRKFVADNSKALLDAWNATRPDDQKLK